MKLLTLFGCALLLAAAVQSQEAPAPTPLPASRYAAMAAKSPFALATAAAPVVEPQASFAANWYISGIGRVGDADFVSIKSRDASTQFSLFGNEPHPTNGVSVASVNWSETIGKSTVILQKGAETAKLEFNEAELRGPPAPGNPVQGGVPGALKGGVRPPTGIAPIIPGGVPAIPGGAPAIPGSSAVNPGAAPQPGAVPRPMPVIVTPQFTNQQFPTTTTIPTAPTTSTNPTEIRRRVRPIVPPPQ